jgi:ABC-type lipoprotein export system ATPase subunit
MGSRVVTETVVRVENVHKSYGHGAAAAHALNGVSLDEPRGELVAIEGRSGSGKTTLLNIVGDSTCRTRGGAASTASILRSSARTGCRPCAGTASASCSRPSG